MTENKKEMENRQQNKKAGKRFAVIMIIACAFGAVIGFLAGRLDGGAMSAEEVLAGFGEALTSGIGFLAPFLLTALTVVVVPYVLIGLKNAKREWNAKKDVDEDCFERIDEKLDRLLGVLSVFLILSYYFFAVGFYYALHEAFSVWFAVSILIFIADMAFTQLYQGRIVDFYKVMNPEKQGSVYDVKFQKKWLESCDEAEREIIYQCGFYAYNVTNYTCIALWLFFTLLAMFAKISLWPVTIISFIWLVLTGSYLMQSRKLSKKKGSTV